MTVTSWKTCCLQKSGFGSIGMLPVRDCLQQFTWIIPVILCISYAFLFHDKIAWQSQQVHHGRANGHSSVRATGTPHVWEESVTEDALSISPFLFSPGCVAWCHPLSGHVLGPQLNLSVNNSQTYSGACLPSDSKHNQVDWHWPSKLSYEIGTIVLAFCRRRSGSWEEMGLDPGSVLSYGCS